ncbi:MAG: hypothetical protein OEV70_14270 [Nitrospirota bacterium]|nr:hypothetical protein [Nitrospirota bacterium]
MKQPFLIMMIFVVVGLAGCGSSPDARKAEADAQIAEEKVKMMQQYNECLKNNEGKADVSTICAPYKEASEAFISK